MSILFLLVKNKYVLPFLTVDEWFWNNKGSRWSCMSHHVTVSFFSLNVGMHLNAVYLNWIGGGCWLIFKLWYLLTKRSIIGNVNNPKSSFFLAVNMLFGHWPAGRSHCVSPPCGISLTNNNLCQLWLLESCCKPDSLLLVASGYAQEAKGQNVKLLAKMDLCQVSLRLYHSHICYSLSSSFDFLFASYYGQLLELLMFKLGAVALQLLWETVF